MAYKKLTTEAASKEFEGARAHMVSAKDDPNDPTSFNLAFAINAYFRSMALAQIEMLNGLNDLLERIDRIETRLNIQPRP
jgi:hypothetical protein